jgi:hypothetical protein
VCSGVGVRGRRWCLVASVIKHRANVLIKMIFATNYEIVVA